jgi:hypothetical protein
MMLAPPSPNHLQPSPSPTQTTFSSLRKMPSSVFHRNERTVTSAKGTETINSMVPKEKKKSRMGLGILGWGSSAQDKAQGQPIPVAHNPPPRPIETVRSVGEAFGRVQAERAETMRLGSYASIQRPLPSPILVNEPLNDLSEAKMKPRYVTTVDGNVLIAQADWRRWHSSPSLQSLPQTATEYHHTYVSCRSTSFGLRPHCQARQSTPHLQLFVHHLGVQSWDQEGCRQAEGWCRWCLGAHRGWEEEKHQGGN